MKRLETPLLATILLLLSGTPAFGQVSLAVTGGVNIASMDISTDDDFVLDLQSVTRLSIRLREVVRFAPYLAAHLAVYRYAIYHER